MIGESARFYARGGWGIPTPPAFAYDLTKGALVKAAAMSGLQRYGKTPGSGDDDTRPLGMAYDIEWMSGIVGTELSPLVSGAALTPLGNVFGAREGFSQGNSTVNRPVSFRSSFNLPKNGAWTISAFLHSWPKGQLLKLHQWFWGAPGAGFLFQIRGESAEIAGLSPAYNESDMATLRVLWAISSPTDTERDSINTLQKKLFVDFESLSFERATGSGKWIGQEWTLSFIAEPRGVLHIVAEGLDATAHEVSAIIKTRMAGVLWEQTPLTLWNGGGAFFFALGQPRFRSKAKMSFGPFKNGYFTQYLGGLSHAYNVDTSGGATVTMTKTDLDEVHFGFDVDVVNPNLRSTLWIYGLNARIAPGVRNGSTDIGLDTDDPYIPTDPAVPRDTGNKILDIVPSWGDSMNRRTAQITIRDIHGLTSTSKPLPVERVGTLEIGGEPFITNGLVLPLKQTDMASLAAGQLPLYTSRFETDLQLTLADGWEILNQTECEPPPIGDNMPIGEHIKEYLALTGFSSAEMAGVPSAGRRVGRAALGEDWAQRVDKTTTCGDAIRSLLDSYGLGLRFYQDTHGVWQMPSQTTASQGAFSSSRVPFPLTEPGRLTILTPIDLSHDSSSFWNHIVVTGGEKGEIVSEWTNWGSILNPNAPDYIGRRKTKRLTNTGLRTQDDVNYATSSMVWRYGRGGRRAQYVTYFHKRFWPGAPIEADGGNWEIEGISGGSWAKDEMQFNLLETR